ncbi:sterol desaturase family protein [Paracoccus sp. MC1862]|uniref:sterol desaturase family protein n=1 Tax=Paracoccus sp. MC1862 TaxID=2760307 RepID=UPI001600204B|nr:sterol desaturase family protein [Paracoccus sp. MC1862]MBB1497975.1 sterol desaturase family protein [Paracoccus sp. MC1862]QQO44359.1 sterol desaturase family protein [Paracoccus sp. MC1862]
MFEVWRIVSRMGHLQRLAPLWLIGMAVLVTRFQPVLLVALAYGVALQFLVEYAMHRFLYHRRPPQMQGPFNQLYRDHIGHHEFPTDPDLLTGGNRWFAAVFALVSAGLHTLALALFMGIGAAAGFSVVALWVGSVSAYVFYEYCHTLAHVNLPKGRFGRHVTRSHLAHHYQDHHATFHVSAGMGWIDRLFGTGHDPQAARARYDRDTMMSLGMDPDDLRLVLARKAWGLPGWPGRRHG